MSGDKHVGDASEWVAMNVQPESGRAPADGGNARTPIARTLLRVLARYLARQRLPVKSRRVLDEICRRLNHGSGASVRQSCFRGERGLCGCHARHRNQHHAHPPEESKGKEEGNQFHGMSR